MNNNQAISRAEAKALTVGQIVFRHIGFLDEASEGFSVLDYKLYAVTRISKASIVFTGSNGRGDGSESTSIAFSFYSFPLDHWSLNNPLGDK